LKKIALVRENTKGIPVSRRIDHSKNCYIKPLSRQAEKWLKIIVPFCNSLVLF